MKLFASTFVWFPDDLNDFYIDMSFVIWIIWKLTKFSNPFFYTFPEYIKLFLKSFWK